jgi:hypothetical protein
MSDRIQRTDDHKSLDELIAATAQHGGDATVTGGNARTILASSYRVVLKSGRLSGARACALSARVAARGIQACTTQPLPIK